MDDPMDDTARPGPLVSRRFALTGAVALSATGALALAGCGSDSTSAPTRPAGGAASAPESTTGSPAEAGSAPATGTGPSEAASAAGAPLVATAEVPVGGATVVTADGAGIVVAQPSPGRFVAHSARCTHRGCTVGVDTGLMLQCPCHGSRYDAATGEVARGPATRALPDVAVTVSDGQVRLG